METVYPIVPAGMRPLVLSDAGLDFRGDVYGRRVPWAALRVQEARVGDLSREPDLQLSPQHPDEMLADLRHRAGRAGA